MADDVFRSVLTGQTVTLINDCPLQNAIIKDFQIVISDKYVTGPVVAAFLTQLFSAYLDIKIEFSYKQKTTNYYQNIKSIFIFSSIQFSSVQNNYK